jgi:hypothetical protein
MMNYRHTLQIELDTQFPQTDQAEAFFKDRVQKILGPWCVDVKVVRLNEELGQ